MKDDPVIKRIRKARQDISRKYNNDPEAIVRHYIDKQKKRAEKAPVRQKK